METIDAFRTIDMAHKHALKIAVVLLISLCIAEPTFASTGVIDGTNYFAWDNNGGWVNWGCG